jgi:hypothetical protein
MSALLGYSLQGWLSFEKSAHHQRNAMISLMRHCAIV